MTEQNASGNGEMQEITPTRPEYYRDMDVGKVYQLMHKATLEQLEAIKIAGINRGQISIVDMTYNIRNRRNLGAVGVSEGDITDILGHEIDDDFEYEDIKGVYEEHEVVYEEPSERELAYTFANAEMRVGFNPLNKTGSAIESYTRLLDKVKPDIAHCLFEIMTEAGPISVNYYSGFRNGYFDVDRALVYEVLRSHGIEVYNGSYGVDLMRKSTINNLSLTDESTTDVDVSLDLGVGCTQIDC